MCRCELGLLPLWHALQACCISQNTLNDVLQLNLGDRPLLVFTEWLAALAAEKQGEVMICEGAFSDEIVNTSSFVSLYKVELFLE